jgi:hypothetical protein
LCAPDRPSATTSLTTRLSNASAVPAHVPLPAGPYTRSGTSAKANGGTATYTGAPRKMNDLTHLCITYYHLNGIALRRCTRTGSINDCDSAQSVGAIVLAAGSLLEATHGRHMAQHAQGRLKSRVGPCRGKLIDTIDGRASPCQVSLTRCRLRGPSALRRHSRWPVADPAWQQARASLAAHGENDRTVWARPWPRHHGSIAAD